VAGFAGDVSLLESEPDRPRRVDVLEGVIGSGGTCRLGGVASAGR
jgi:hypothetical protein